MTNRILISFFMGFIAISILDFLFFIGLQLNYFEHYGINIYFNALFAQNQNLYILTPLTLLTGYMLMYNPFAKQFLKLYVIIIILFATTLYQPIGQKAGETIFSKQNQTYQLGSTTFNGSTLYEARGKIYIYRKDLKRTIELDASSVVVD